MPSMSAEYMRAYRARKRSEAGAGKDGRKSPKAPRDPRDPRDQRIAELEDEVRHLKRQLAARQTPTFGQFNSRPFTPVPKVPSRSR